MTWRGWGGQSQAGVHGPSATVDLCWAQGGELACRGMLTGMLTGTGDAV